MKSIKSIVFAVFFLMIGWIIGYTFGIQGNCSDLEREKLQLEIKKLKIELGK